MFEPLGSPAFLTAARIEGKKASPIKTFLFFLIVYFIGTFAQSILLSPIMYTTMLSDPAYYDIINMAAGEVSTSVLNEQIAEYVTALAERPPIVIASLFATVGTVIASVVFCRRIEKRSYFSMGLVKKGAFPAYLRGCLFGLVLFAVAIGFSMLFGGFWLRGINGKFNFLLCLLLLLGFLLQGFSEEMLCRGLLMVSMGRVSPLPYALTISSLTFALLHTSNAGFAFLPFVNLTLFGFLMGLYMIRGGSIWGAAALHSVWNFAEGVLGGFRVSGMKMPTSLFRFTAIEGKEIFTGGAFGPEGSLGVTFVLAVAVAILAMSKTKSSVILYEIPKEE